MKYQLIGPGLELTDSKWVFLSQHPDFKGYWKVEGFEGFLTDFYEIIGPYQALSVLDFPKFFARANQGQYQVGFFENPEEALVLSQALADPPDIYLKSDFAATIGGLLPFQLEGYNYLKQKQSGIALWSTGLGKANLLAALVKHAFMQNMFDFALVVAKAHNKTNLQRTLKNFAGLDSIVIEGTANQRRKLYEGCIEAPRGTVLVLNYEKFRDDFCDCYKKHDRFHVDISAVGKFFFSQDLLICWDEAPTKLKNRSTQLYKAVCKCLYQSAPALKQQRPKSLKQYVFTATPIENNPDDFFSVVRLLSPETFGSVKQFQDEFVESYNSWNQYMPATWKNLERMGLKAGHLIHKVDKSDPDIAAQFPDIIEDKVFIDWENRKAYNQVERLVRDLPETGIFAQILLLQMMCDMPTMLQDSANKRLAYEEQFKELYGDDFPIEGIATPEGSLGALEVSQRLTEPITDTKHPKLERLKELVLEEHPEEKVVLFSSFNKIFFPKLMKLLDQWKVSYVYYDGKDKQKAYDSFQQDPNIRVFLSSDQGSDSINLHAAGIVIHYNLPWKWSTLIQRQNRIHRLSSTHEKVIFYSLIIADSVEDRKLQILEKKKSFHEGVFEGAEKLSKLDLQFILSGDIV